MAPKKTETERARIRLLKLRLKKLSERERKIMIEESIIDGNGGKYNQWNFGQRLSKAIDADEELRTFCILNIGHQVAREDDHTRRPDFYRNDLRPELPFDYDAVRNKVIPVGVAEGKDEPQLRVPLGLAGINELNGYLKIIRDNQIAVTNKFKISEEAILMMTMALENDPTLKTCDDVMRKGYGWTPAPEPETEYEDA